MPWLPPWCDLILFPFTLVCLLGFGALLHSALSRALKGFQTASPEAPLDAFIGIYALGIGGFALFMFFFGAAGLLYRPIFWGILLAGNLLFLKYRRGIQWRAIAQDLKPTDRVELLMLLMVAAILGFHFNGCLLPTFGQDELTYHLTMPRQYIIAHGIHETPNLLHGNFPYNAEMIYLFCLGLGSEMLAKMIQWSMLVMTLIALAGAMRRLAGGCQYLAALLYLVPIGGVYVRSPMETGSDVMTGFFLAAGLYFIAAAARDGWARTVVLASLANGFAWGAKYVAPVFVTPLLIPLLLWKGRALGLSWRSLLWSLVFMGGATLALFSPWMTKDALYTGNPLYPMLNSLFPVREPYDAIARRLFRYEHNTSFYSPNWEWAREEEENTFLKRFLDSYRMKLSWAAHEGDILLPFFLAASILGLFLPAAKGNANSFGGTGKYIFSPHPQPFSLEEKGATWFPRPQGEGQGEGMRSFMNFDVGSPLRGFAIAGCVANLIFLLIYGAHINRFFSMAYPLAALVAALFLDYLLRRIRWEIWLRLLFALFLGYTMLNFQLRWLRIVHWDGYPCVTEAAQTKFLSRYVDNLEWDEAWKKLPDLIPEGSWILGHGVRFPYFIPRKIYSVCDFEEELLNDLYRKHNGWHSDEGAANPIYKTIHEMGFTHLVMHGQRLLAEQQMEALYGKKPEIASPKDLPERAILFPPKEWLDRYTELLLGVPGLEMRRIRQPEEISP